jgi:hypothetical protein
MPQYNFRDADGFSVPVNTPVSDGEVPIWSEGFSLSGASVLGAKLRAPVVGAGVTYNQTSGALNIVSGTTANAEFLTRSLESFSGPMRLRFTAVLSQRIANNNFAVLLADLIGDALAFAMVNATTMDVVIPAHGFTAQMVGQFVLAGGFAGLAGAIPGRYAIASIQSADVVRFTVAGFPSSGSGTVTLFGRNYIRNLFTGTTATAMNFDAQRNGWATGDTAATVLTSATPGLMVVNELTGRDVYLLDSLRATTAAPNLTSRASRVENIPDHETPLFVFIWAFNGTTNPASTTTFTMGHVAVEPVINNPVMIAGMRAQGAVNPLPVAVQAGAAAIGSVSVTGNPAVVGAAAEDSAASGNPVLMAGVVRDAVAPTTLVAGDVARHTMTRGGAMVQKPYAVTEAEWSASLALTNTTAQALQAALANVKRKITALQAINTGGGTVELILLDGTTERWRLPLPVNVPVPIVFPTGLVTTVNTALNANLSAAGTVRINAQGYTEA